MAYYIYDFIRRRAHSSHICMHPLRTVDLAYVCKYTRGLFRLTRAFCEKIFFYEVNVRSMIFRVEYARALVFKGIKINPSL